MSKYSTKKHWLKPRRASHTALVMHEELFKRWLKPRRASHVALMTAVAVSRGSNDSARICIPLLLEFLPDDALGGESLYFAYD